jgi:hypothetical protein
MSRSFKHVPIIKDATCKKYGKKYANKKVRKIDIDSGGAYKKVYESYNICDYSFSLFNCDKKDAIPVWGYSNYGDKMTYDEIMKYWRK